MGSVAGSTAWAAVVIPRKERGANILMYFGLNMFLLPINALFLKGIKKKRVVVHKVVMK
jgi:hypothetical protein